jgi:hypothetical protein
LRLSSSGLLDPAATTSLLSRQTLVLPARPKCERKIKVPEYSRHGAWIKATVVIPPASQDRIVLHRELGQRAATRIGLPRDSRVGLASVRFALVGSLMGPKLRVVLIPSSKLRGIPPLRRSAPQAVPTPHATNCAMLPRSLPVVINGYGIIATSRVPNSAEKSVPFIAESHNRTTHHIRHT